MYPRPPDIPSVKLCCSRASQLPASPPNTPERSTPQMRIQETEIPAPSRARGPSPAERSERPNPVPKSRLCARRIISTARRKRLAEEVADGPEAFETRERIVRHGLDPRGIAGAVKEDLEQRARAPSARRFSARPERIWSARARHRHEGVNAGQEHAGSDSDQDPIQGSPVARVRPRLRRLRPEASLRARC